MRKPWTILIALVTVSLVFVSWARSQDYPEYDIHGGFAYSGTGERDWFGWQISANRNFNHYFGISFSLFSLNASKTEYIFLRKYKTNAHRYYFLAGPEFTNRDRKKWIPYAHALAGASITSVSYTYELDRQTQLTGTYKRNSFAFMLGGGFKYRIRGPLVVYLIQADFIANLIDEPYDKWEDGAMISFGLGYTWRHSDRPAESMRDRVSW